MARISEERGFPRRGVGDPTRGHDHRDCIESALRQAEDHCRRKGARLTETRRRVLELVWASHEPVGAYELLEQLKVDQPKAMPPTVYRALDFLLGQGLLHRIESFNSFIGCALPGQPHAGHFLLCRSCGQAAEIEGGRIALAISADAADYGFVVEQDTVELRGLCASCQGQPDS